LHLGRLALILSGNLNFRVTQSFLDLQDEDEDEDEQEDEEEEDDEHLLHMMNSLLIFLDMYTSRTCTQHT
jgi:hypothetical protein